MSADAKVLVQTAIEKFAAWDCTRLDTVEDAVAAFEGAVSALAARGRDLGPCGLQLWAIGATSAAQLVEEALKADAPSGRHERLSIESARLNRSMARLTRAGSTRSSAVSERNDP